jgi:phage gp45-like
MGVILNEDGKVIRVYTGKNQDSTDDRLLIQAELAEKNDTQVIEQRQHAGFSSRPPLDNKRLFVTRINNSYLVSLAEEDGILNDDLSPGETRVYGSDGGSIVCEIYFKNDGSIDISAPGEINVTAPKVNVTGDVIADSGATVISLKNHFHQGNLGYPTGTPIMSGGGSTPATPPTTNASGDIIDGSTTNLSTHTHSQPNDSDGDTESNTSAPL